VIRFGPRTFGNRYIRDAVMLIPSFSPGGAGFEIPDRLLCTAGDGSSAGCRQAHCVWSSRHSFAFHALRSTEECWAQPRLLPGDRYTLSGVFQSEINLECVYS